MNEILLTCIINDLNKTFTILGTLTGEDEERLIKLITELNRQGNEIRREAFQNENSIIQNIAELREVNNGYRFVPVNEIIPRMNLIQFQQ